ncbi:MAG: 3-phosphoshikimate 1-carboxyvinyltransferase [Lachnospiraceae bacterium]|nr:3-phosphoshikimate 1-carboxyvinyltransferase [Lachnospiraceae bacterium]
MERQTKKYHVKTVYKNLKDSKGEKLLTAHAPGSKSITNRALLIATLAEGETLLKGVLFSDDSRNFLNCVKDLGVDIEVDEDKKTVIVHGCDGQIPKSEAEIYVGSAGTAARFLAACLGISKGKYYLTSSAQMKKRPMAPLLNSLREIGCEVTCDDGDESFPFTLKGRGVCKDEVSVNIDSSSQFLSALLISAVLSDRSFAINVTGSHGKAYIDMTLKMMESFGVRIKKEGSRYLISGSERYKAPVDGAGSGIYRIEPDASAAAYFYAMCPVLNIPVCVPGVRFDSLQGDVEFIRVLEKMGCRVYEYKKDEAQGDKDIEDLVSGSDCEQLRDGDIILLPPENGSYSGIDVDMSSFSDQAITLAAIAPFANSPTTIRGIGHIRLQESDRLSAIVTELGKMGIKTENGEDWIKIYPGDPQPSIVDTYNDHRMAMGFSLIGLRAEGIVIDNPGCCSKTFAEYFDVLDEICDKYENA